jgi:hypothetical protein
MSQMLDYVVARLKEAKVEDVAEATGQSAWTLRKIRIGAIPNPGIKSIEPLYRYFQAKEGKALRRKSA